MPTGGVNAKNLADYLAFDQIVACGGTWMVKKDLIQQENWAEITRLSREAVRTMLGFSLDHVGINCGSEAEADRLARTLCDMFGFSYQMGNSSVQALHAVECTKTPGRGTHGHIAIATSNVDRAVYHLGLCGIRCLPETRKTDAKGNTKAIYIDGEFGGFAIHLVRR
jgi:2-dehydro-3-deoxyphosphogluconate aldolase/4-hydroxy-2-oxoglutarate aldolase